MPRGMYKRKVKLTRPVKLDIEAPAPAPKPGPSAPWRPTMGEVIQIHNTLTSVRHCWDMWADDAPGERYWEKEFRKAVQELTALVPRPDPEDTE